MFKKQKYRMETLKKIAPYAIGVRKYFALIAIISCISMATSFITPEFFRLFVDRVIIGREFGIFSIVIVGYLGLFVVNTLLSYLRIYAGNRLLNRTLYKIRHRILCNYFVMPFGEYEKRLTSDMKMRIDDDSSKLAAFGDAQTIDYVKSCMTAIVAAVLILTLEWRLALISMIVIPLTFYLDHIISLKEKKLQEINRINNERWNDWLQNSIQGWKEVKALNLQKHETRIFVRYAHNYAEYFGRWINYWVARVLVIPKIKDEFLMKFALYFFGGLFIMKEKMSIGELLVFAMYYELLKNSIRDISSADAELQSNMPFYDRVINELSSHNRLHSHKSLPEYSTSTFCLRNVSYAYDSNLIPVVENLSLDIQQGERVAITGRSGSGKTTVLKLLSGILKPTSGEVLFSNKNLNQVSNKFFYKKIGFILQENQLFNMTIGENLKLSNPKAEIPLLDEVCKKACIYDFIHAQPDGYDTLIGENGVKLSGGQRQRLVLARLFLRNVDVMIFDEATSALDQYSEGIIHDAIHAIGREKTIIVVAHRESSIALCDRVISLD